MSLRLESATAIRLYYTGDKIDGITVAFGGSNAAFTEGTAKCNIISLNEAQKVSPTD